MCRRFSKSIGVGTIVMSMSSSGSGGSSGGTIVLSVGAVRSYAEVVGNNCKSTGVSFQLRRFGGNVLHKPFAFVMELRLCHLA